MVYGRQIAGRTLELEASGALMSASLVMRDRQTDSWWSLMSSKAIGGPLEGTALPELPVGEKVLWGDWRKRHPESLVLAVEGKVHVAENRYETYFHSAETFRGHTTEDQRLPAKEPIFAFLHAGKAWAVPHRALSVATTLTVPGTGRRIQLERPTGSSVLASTRAWWLPAEGDPGEREPLAGFDTFWYTWVGVNAGSEILAAAEGKSEDEALSQPPALP